MKQLNKTGQDYTVRSLPLEEHEYPVMICSSFAESLRDGRAKYFSSHYLKLSKSNELKHSSTTGSAFKVQSLFSVFTSESLYLHRLPAKRESAHIFLG